MRWLVSADFEIPYGVLREEVAVTLRNRIGVTSFEFRFEFHYGSEIIEEFHGTVQHYAYVLARPMVWCQL